jgi:hypothetical protein
VIYIPDFEYVESPTFAFCPSQSEKFLVNLAIFVIFTLMVKILSQASVELMVLKYVPAAL